MDWQQIAALSLVGMAVTLALWKRWRRRRSPGCGGGCCPSTPSKTFPSA